MDYLEITSALLKANRKGFNLDSCELIEIGIDEFLTEDHQEEDVLAFAVLFAVSKQLNRIEEIVMNTSQQVLRLQQDMTTMQTTLNNQTKAVADVLAAIAAGNAQLEADIAALRNNAGGGDAAALSAIADSMEASLKNYQGIADQLEAAATTESQVDPALTISPASVTVPRGSTQQFSASAPSTFTAQSGTVDSTGLYTPPTDTTITSDQVTATISDGTGKTATASILISDAQPNASAPASSPAATKAS